MGDGGSDGPVWHGSDDGWHQALISALPAFVVGALCLCVGLADLALQSVSVSEETKKGEDAARIGVVVSRVQAGVLAFVRHVAWKISICTAVVALALVVAFTLHPVASKANGAEEDWSDGLRISSLFCLGALFCATSSGFSAAFAALGSARTAVACSLAGGGGGGKLAFHAAAAAGVAVCGLALCGLSAAFLFVAKPGRSHAEAAQLVQSFAVGASFAAVMLRVASGTFSQSAKIGAGLLATTEPALTEDDALNPAAVADRVGDAVGRAAGASASHFETFVCALSVAMKLGAHRAPCLAIPLWLGIASMLGAGISSLGAALLQRVVAESSFAAPMVTAPHKLAFHIAVVAFVGFTILALCLLLGSANEDSWKLFGCTSLGVVYTVLMGHVAQYFCRVTLTGPVASCKDRARIGAAPALTQGIAVGMVSTAPAAGLLAVTLVASAELAGDVGIAIAAVGSMSSFTLAVECDVFGAIAHTAGGLLRMACPHAQEAHNQSQAIARLGSSGVAASPGAAIGAATLASIVALIAFVREVKGPSLMDLEVAEPMLLAGTLLGAMSPYCFGALTFLSAGGAIAAVLREARRQLECVRGPKGLALQDVLQRIAGGDDSARSEAVEPDSAVCVALLAERSSGAAMPPAAFAVLLPLTVALLVGARALSGFVFGMIVVAPMSALMFRNAGGVWASANASIRSGDQAFIRASQSQACAVANAVGGAVGGIAGPALDSLLKFSATSSLLVAPLFEGRGPWEDWPWGVASAALGVAATLGFIGAGVVSWKGGYGDGDDDDKKSSASGSSDAPTASEAADSEAAPMMGKPGRRRRWMPRMSAQRVGKGTFPNAKPGDMTHVYNLLRQCCCSRITKVVVWVIVAGGIGVAASLWVPGGEYRP